MNLPKSRRDNLLTTELEEEVVVYDPERKQAHSLNRVAVAVWSHCDGETTSLAELQRRVSAEVGTPVTEAAVWLALRKLERAHLLMERIGSSDAMTRRQLIGQAGRLGAAAVATPIVLSALVPVSAAAISVCSGTSAVCQTGCRCQSLFPAPGSPPTTQCVTGGVPGVACTTAVGGASNCAAGTGKCYVSGTTTICPVGGLNCVCACQSNVDCGGATTVCISNFPNFCATPCTGPFSCTCP
jgi:hypothetical protein